MARRSSVTACLLSVGAMLVAAPAVTSATSSASRSKTVTPAGNGRTVTIVRRGTLSISLAHNNPSTGYAWRFRTRPSKAILKLVSDKTTKPAVTDPPMTGVPEPRTIVYRALKAGRTKIKLALVGPGGVTGGTLAITVIVR
jgi:predicted secreted protein